MSSQPLLGAPALVVEKREKSSLNTTLRFTLLRSILALSIIILSLILRSIVACQFFSRESWGNVPLSQSSDCIAVPNILYISASLVVFVHHFTSAFGRRLSLPGILDLVLLIAECAIAVWTLAYSYSGPQSDFLFAIYDENALLLSASMWTFLIVLLLYTGLRISTTFKTKSFLDRVDVSRSEGGKCSTPTEVLFGRAVWRAQFLNEQRWLIGLRGATTILCLSAIIVFAFTKILMEPVGQLITTSVKDLRTRLFPDVLYSTDIDFNVVLNHLPNTTSDLIKAVSVTKSTKSEVVCSGSPIPVERPLPKEVTGSWFQEDPGFVKFDCGNEFDALSHMPLQINVAVNFTVLLENNPEVDPNATPVKLRVGLTNDTNYVLAQSPVLLVPGLNAIGQTSLGIRQHYKMPAVFTLGLFHTWITYIVAEIAYLYNNPNNTSTAPDASFLRIYIPFDEIYEFRITQDYTDSSVLNGFSATGGLWTFLGSIVALLFGSTIVQSITGSKPLSIFKFGLLHSGDKGQIGEGYMKKYPRLESDLSMESREQGLLCLLRDNLLKPDMFPSSKGNDEVEKGGASETNDS